MICNICQFPWCDCSHHGHCQAVNVIIKLAKFPKNYHLAFVDQSKGSLPSIRAISPNSFSFLGPEPPAKISPPNTLFPLFPGPGTAMGLFPCALVLEKWVSLARKRNLVGDKRSFSKPGGNVEFADLTPRSQINLNHRPPQASSPAL